jgi:hypothetical protein
MKISVIGMAAIGLLVSMTAYAGSATPQSSGFDYAQFSTLPYNVQAGYFNAVQEVLVEMDSKSGNSHSSLEWIFDQMICSANGDEDGPFCINVGIVQKHDACPTEPGKFHDFNTNDYFKKIGLGISDPACPGGAPDDIPCSPFFGFNQKGNLYCTNNNLTRSCESISEKDKESHNSLVSVIKDCALTGKSSSVTISCKALPKFLHNQIDIVDEFCKRDSRLACGRLARQMDRIAKTEAEMEKSSDNKDLVAKIGTYLDEANKPEVVAPAKPDCPPSNTPPASTVGAPVTKQELAASGAPKPPGNPPVVAAPLAPASGSAATKDKNGIPIVQVPPVFAPADCATTMDIGKDLSAGDQDLNDYWAAGFDQAKKNLNAAAFNAKKQSSTKVFSESDPVYQCVRFNTKSSPTDKDDIAFTLSKNVIGVPQGGTVQLPAKEGAPAPAPIFLDGTAIKVMFNLSKTYEAPGDGPLSLKGSELISNYLPVTPIQSAGTMNDEHGKPWPAVSYTTASGAVITYALVDSAAAQIVTVTKDKKTFGPIVFLPQNVAAK